MKPAACLTAVVVVLVAGPPPSGANDKVPSFETDVQSILRAHCLACHGGRTRENGLDLRSREAMLTGGKTGSAVLPGSLRDSLLWTFVATDKMPANENKLSSQQKSVLRQWILAGAPTTDSQAASIAASQEKRPSQTRKEAMGVEATVAKIDRLIDQRLKQEGVKASPNADDAEFLRRVYLDLAGRVPNYRETRGFLEDTRTDKRARLIEARLASDEFGRHLGILWHKLLIPKSAGAYTRIPHDKFRAWLAQQFREGAPWDAVVTELITAEGYLPSNKNNELARKKDAKLQPQNVATSFINVHNTEGRPQPKGIVASVSRIFLAQSIECAQCHNHPLAKWEQTDFWAAAAFFERVRFQKAVYGDTSIGRLIEPSSGSDLVYDDKSKGRYSFVQGVYTEPVIDLQDANGTRTGRMIRAKFLGGIRPELAPQQSYRAAFADWATSPDNPYFSRAMVNRVWSQLLGRGFVEPVDDMSEDNRPSHPELLDDLSREFAASQFDLKHLIRCICNSRTYQRSSTPGESQPADPRLFSGQLLKQMTEEQLLDSLAVVLPTFAVRLDEDARDKNPGLFRREFLEVHETEVDSSTEHTRGLQQALRMMNGDGRFFNREALKDVVSSKESPEENVRQVYLLALNRHPDERELATMTQFVQEGHDEIAQLDKRRLPQRKRDHPDNTPDPYADLLWVLLNSGEFIFNH